MSTFPFDTDYVVKRGMPAAQMQEPMTEQIRQNRFDLLRLIFATTVFIGHAYILPQALTLPQAEQVFAITSELAIEGFFIISGGLVYGSYLRSRTLAGFSGKRVRRLYPAYAAIILIPAILAMALVPEAQENLTETGKYILANLVFLNFLQPDLPGVFQDHRFSAVNGALWTIKIEVMYYLGVPILVWLMTLFGRYKLGLLVFIYIAAEAWRLGFTHLGLETSTALWHELSRQLPGQMSFFISGVVLWDQRDLVRRHWLPVGAIGMAVLLASYLPGCEPVRAIGLCALVGSIAFSPGPALNAARFGDFSYGIYITHFPITQTAIALGLFATSASIWIGYGVVAAMTLISAVALWHLIEKPFLHKKNWYRQREAIHKGTA